MKVRLLRVMLCCIIPVQLPLQCRLETEQLRTALSTLSGSELSDNWNVKKESKRGWSGGAER